MTYGKIFAKLYRGSMVGAGIEVFALMPYIITEGMPDKVHGGYIEMNPVLIAAIFGTTPERIEKAIEYLCSPDPDTTTPGDDGRRLVKLGPFSYRIVNYAHYKAIRNEEERREQNRVAQEKFRQKKKEEREKREARKAKKTVDQFGTMNARLIEEAEAAGDLERAERLRAMWDKGVEERASAADL